MPNTLPRIACFHGGGSNASIYEIQCSSLARLLSDTFQFEFFEGPFTRSAGPGIIPAFADYGPFKSWFDPNAEPGGEDGSGYDDAGRDGIERVLRLMEERGRVKGGGGEWVGVIGFSQGTRVVGGLLLDQQRRERVGVRGVVDGIRLKFGVCCMGGGKPMEGEIGYQMDEPDTVIRIPTVHLHGLKDEFLPLGRDQLAKYYDRDTATLYEINYHHAMPWVRAESEELARLIKELYQKTKDK